MNKCRYLWAVKSAKRGQLNWTSALSCSLLYMIPWSVCGNSVDPLPYASAFFIFARHKAAAGRIVIITAPRWHMYGLNLNQPVFFNTVATVVHSEPLGIVRLGGRAVILKPDSAPSSTVRIP